MDGPVSRGRKRLQLINDDSATTKVKKLAKRWLI